MYVLGNSFVESLSKMLIISVSDVYRRRINSACGPSSLISKNVIEELKILKPNVIIIPFFTRTSDEVY